MATLSNAPERLTLPLPPAPDTAPVLAAAEARLSVITTRALPQARARVAFLESIWASPDDRNAVPVFAQGEAPVPCHSAGVDRLFDAAAHASALTAEVAALTALQAAIAVYDAGGPLVVDGNDAPQMDRRTIQSPGEPADFPDLRARTKFVRQLRQYIAAVERELGAAKASRTAAGLKAELGALHARLHDAIRAVRRRPRDGTAGRTRTRKIA